MARQTCPKCRSIKVKKMVEGEENAMNVENSGESLQIEQKNLEKAQNNGF